MNVFGVSFCNKQVIGPPDNPLLIRWVLLRLKAWGVFLHKFCRSDYDRALHDHPWPFVSVILRGGYWEIHDQTLDGRQTQVWHGPGRVLLRPAEWRHRVEIDKPSWSLILVGRRVRRWGFFLSTGWCWWRKHNPDLGICADEILWTGGKD